MNNRDRAAPVQLAEEIVKVVGDADSSTALTALDIARLLIVHREEAAIKFERDCVSDQSQSSSQ